METQYIFGKHSALRLNLFLGLALLSSIAQASVETSLSLLPQTLEQSLQQPSHAQAEQKENKALSQTEIIDQATSQSADAHMITKNKDGSVRIPSPMQDVIATLTPTGARIYSDDVAGETFALLVNGLGRDKSKLTQIKPGKVSHDEKIARLFHNNLIEEFSTSSAGIRQDFFVSTAPKGKGKLVVELDIEGATARLNNKGTMLTLKSGRELAYHNLMVADAAGKTLSAHFVVKDKQTLRIVVDDKGAQYPVRIDPTITDADWFSLGAAFPVPDDIINALATDGAGNLYMGGSFSTLSGIANTSGIAKWDGNNWSSLGSTNSRVRALIWEGNTLYAGGDFTTAGNVAANHIAKWNGNSWSSLGSGTNDGVYALAFDGSNIYAGGFFNIAGNISAYNIAKWDGNAWSSLGSGTNEQVLALTWDGTNLYAGGDFTTAGGIATNYIAKWDGNSWTSLGSGMGGFYVSIQALAWDGTYLYAGGFFDTAGAVSTFGIARWDGNTWSALGSGSSNPVSSLAFDGINLYAGGGGIKKWDGNTWSTLGSGTGSVSAIAFDGNNLYAGGSFDTAGNITAFNIAKWNGSSWNALGSGMNDQVRSLAWDGSNLYVGGWFVTAGSETANYVAKWDGNNWSSLGSGVDRQIEALTFDGTFLYAGGTFKNAGGVSANHIAKWDGNTWSALGSGLNHVVYTLASDGTNLYAGGIFTAAGGGSANYIAKWNGSTWSPLGSGMDWIVTALAWDGTNLYAGGDFTSAGGITANHIAKWDGNTWSALGLGVNEDVRALAWDGTNLYAGGWFTNASGVSANYIAKWDGNTWSALGSGVNEGVEALAWDGANLYAGGSFTSAGGIAAERIARWNGSNWNTVGSIPNMANKISMVNALIWNDTNLYVGGEFITAGDKDAGYVAGINIDLTTPDSLVFTNQTNIPLNTLVSSEVVDIRGVVSVDISITGGEYSLNGGTWASAPGTASNNDTLQLRTTSSTNYNSTTDVVVTVGSGSDTWSLTTLTDTVPDAFNFIDQTAAALNTSITSNTITITGLGASSPISVTGGEYSINGSSYGSAEGFVNNNDTVTVRSTSSSSYNTAVNVVLTIGGISDSFTVTTLTNTNSNAGSGGSTNLYLISLLSLLVLQVRRRAVI